MLRVIQLRKLGLFELQLVDSQHTGSCPVDSQHTGSDPVDPYLWLFDHYRKRIVSA